MKILNGKKLADKILARLRRTILRQRLRLKLAAVLIGNDPASLSFIRKKKQACEKIGIGFALYQFPATISQQKLEREVKSIAKNPAISGMIIQLPLPKSLNIDSVLNSAPLKKDVDCLGKDCREMFAAGKSKILPPVVGAVKELFQAYKIKIQGKEILIIGKGRLVGQPLITWLSKAKETGSPSLLRVLVADKSTQDLTGLTRQADVIITGTGKPGLISGKMIKKGAVIIDVGSAKKDGKIVGDVDFESCVKKAGAVSPVPGGVGPLTVACLLENLVELNNAKSLRS
mgnify:CR=1 FL=1